MLGLVWGFEARALSGARSPHRFRRAALSDARPPHRFRRAVLSDARPRTCRAQKIREGA